MAKLNSTMCLLPCATLLLLAGTTCTNAARNIPDDDHNTKIDPMTFGPFAGLGGAGGVPFFGGFGGPGGGGLGGLGGGGLGGLGGGSNGGGLGGLGGGSDGGGLGGLGGGIPSGGDDSASLPSTSSP